MNLPGYDEWKLRGPDEPSPMDEAMAEIEQLRQENAELEDALHECLDYFEGRSDVIDGDYGVPAPNEEMKMASMIKSALRGQP